MLNKRNSTSVTNFSNPINSRKTKIPPRPIPKGPPESGTQEQSAGQLSVYASFKEQSPSPQT
ncbi:MAG: hypothetical protein ACQESG_06650, partial [Nanobdellota archaeon]